MYVRGCEVEGMLDENGRVIEEGPEPKPQLVGEKRTFRVLLDCNQYHADMVLLSIDKPRTVVPNRGAAAPLDVLRKFIKH
jgi:hypothetical protein